jgi:hypothetical protein
MNGNSYYITSSFILCNTDSYYSVITITVYQTCPKKQSVYLPPRCHEYERIQSFQLLFLLQTKLFYSLNDNIATCKQELFQDNEK